MPPSRSPMYNTACARTAHGQRTLSSALTSSSVVGRCRSNTQSVMEVLVSGTRTARPFSLPCTAVRQYWARQYSSRGVQRRPVLFHGVGAQGPSAYYSGGLEFTTSSKAHLELREDKGDGGGAPGGRGGQVHEPGPAEPVHHVTSHSLLAWHREALVA